MSQTEPLVWRPFHWFAGRFYIYGSQVYHDRFDLFDGTDFIGTYRTLGAAQWAAQEIASGTAYDPIAMGA